MLESEWYRSRHPKTMNYGAITDEMERRFWDRITTRAACRNLDAPRSQKKSGRDFFMSKQPKEERNFGDSRALPDPIPSEIICKR
ncbi:hypothetical protein SLA2020_398760 [Shorea laevis]